MYRFPQLCSAYKTRFAGQSWKARPFKKPLTHVAERPETLGDLGRELVDVDCDALSNVVKCGHDERVIGLYEGQYLSFICDLACPPENRSNPNDVTGYNEL
jgi:hypothetical protein